MKYTIISQVYTIIAFGASILLWIPTHGMRLTPSAEGTPLYSTHPYFTAQLLLMLSTAIVWIVTLPIFLYSLVKGKIPKTRSTTQNSFVISLALATMVAAISGSIFFSKSVRVGLGPIDPFARVYWLGILFCEGLWIAWTIFVDGPEILGKRARAHRKRYLFERVEKIVEYCWLFIFGGLVFTPHLFCVSFSLLSFFEVVFGGLLILFCLWCPAYFAATS